MTMQQQPVLTCVVAMDRQRLIGADNRLPWHLPADLAHFKRLTLGGTLLMGRRTFESIGRPLPQRRSIVLSRDPGFQAEGCTVVDSVEAALDAAGDMPEVFVIGGARLFEQLLPQCGRLHLTVIDHEFQGDTWMPELDAGWQEVNQEAHEPDARNAWPYRFITLERSAMAQG
ncbi:MULTISPECIES: dihydrofolate reductase [Ectothiorhodospira]|uniref:dihydrofolate reductase n=1 Tax=Ectothiorhodospira TaxID=1051 RepID=UPI001EE95D2D|nr:MULTISPECIES: dihydrofolate reductase [Ectothiorhodospira]MCG5494461.1 dihydrofolate reductase [Ectothiorhodospira variabilis]MCG5503168.1 dihydrofolate reductase [Ectothiorhodospira variabilis]MCG5506073.1 dihydrofolate reductase [Ectothiorhodospira variabilis]MCG5523945.1 dihydrofolate reductase [Ectothiorhodospira haloalkaliphila]